LLLARERLRVALVAAPPHANAAPDMRAHALNAAARGRGRAATGVRTPPDRKPAKTALRYTVRVVDAASHHVEVELLIAHPAALQRVSLPAWIPGNYLCRICSPIAQLWGKKPVKNGPLRSICSRRPPSPTGSW
jgi:hypothetical protein